MLANAGVPMLAIELPVMVIALVPIVLLEAWMYARSCGVDWNLAWRGAAWANVLSTFVGIPLVWLLQVAFQMSIGGGAGWGIDSPLLKLAAITLQSAWLIPYEDHLDWMIPAAALFLLLPAIVVSIPCEQLILRRWFEATELKRVKSAVVRANLASYALLAACWIGLAVATW